MCATRRFGSRRRTLGQTVPPEPDRLVADVDPALGQQILDVAQRQRLSHVHHHDQTDDLRRAVELQTVAHGQGIHGQRVAWVWSAVPSRRHRPLGPSGEATGAGGRMWAAAAADLPARQDAAASSRSTHCCVAAQLPSWYTAATGARIAASIRGPWRRRNRRSKRRVVRSRRSSRSPAICGGDPERG